jgi:hypothetical protein
MPTCGFPTRWTPEAAKVCAVGRPGPGQAVKVVCPWALHLDSQASVPHLHHDTWGNPVRRYSGEEVSPPAPLLRWRHQRNITFAGSKLSRASWHAAKDLDVVNESQPATPGRRGLQAAERCAKRRSRRWRRPLGPQDPGLRIGWGRPSTRATRPGPDAQGAMDARQGRQSPEGVVRGDRESV